MTARDQLRVRVNDELVLDAGTSEEVSGPHGPERLIRPPRTTLFHRVLAYLRAKPDPPKRPSGTMAGLEGVAGSSSARSRRMSVSGAVRPPPWRYPAP